MEPYRNTYLDPRKTLDAIEAAYRERIAWPQTHYEGCELTHIGCALSMVIQLARAAGAGSAPWPRL